MEDCVFCKIASGEYKSYKYWENDDFICILDINPNIDGASLLITKKHYSSDYTKVPSEVIIKAFNNINIPVNKLKKAFGTTKVGLVIEGVGVDHFHIKLYPLIGLNDNTKENDKRIKYDKYEGFLSTQLGPRAGDEELTRVLGLLL